MSILDKMGSLKFDISFMYADNIHELKTLLTYKGFIYLNGGRFAFGWHKVSSIDKNIFLPSEEMLSNAKKKNLRVHYL
jgi:hypothetical protein